MENPSVEAILFVKQEGLSDKVHFVQGLSNEELADMYSSATATFFLVNTKALDCQFLSLWHQVHQ